MSVDPKPHNQMQSGLSDTLVRAQLERILANEVFRRSERISTFLRYVVEESLRGNADGLKEQVIAQDVYGRSADFDAAADPIVRVDARRLRDKLREYYSEATADPIIISLPKGSYAPVFERNPTATPVLLQSGPKPESAPRLLPTASQWRWAAGIIGAIAAASAGWYLLPSSKQPSPRLLPLTSLPGIESHPSLSPDGNFVAFSWDGGGGPADIYIKATESENLRRLTETSESETSPAWSPDGREIAFVRQQGGVFLVSALGGGERKISDSGTHVDWGWDSKTIIIRDRCPSPPPYFCLFEIALDTLARRQLTSPEIGIGDWRFSSSPDGRTLAFIRYGRPGVGDVYVVPMRGGEPRRLTQWNGSLLGVAWTPDGRELVYSVQESSGYRLWRIPAAGAAGNGQRITAAGEDADYPSISRPAPGRAARLAYQKLTEHISLRLVDLAAPRQGDRITAAVPFVQATSRDCSARFSPDARETVFSSHRTGEKLLWMSRRDGFGLRKLSSFTAPQLVAGGWSPDGRRITFDASVDGNTDVYVIDAAGGQPVRLTTEPSTDVAPNWSPDGRWIYFTSNRSGSIQIWKVSPEGGAPVQVTWKGGFQAQSSPDGQDIYYLDRPPPGATGASGVSNLKRIPVLGGEETVVLDRVPAFYWSVSTAGIFILSLGTEHDWVDFYDFSKQTRIRVGRLPFRASRECGFTTASRDGRWLMMNHVDRLDSNLMLVDNFR